MKGIHLLRCHDPKDTQNRITQNHLKKKWHLRVGELVAIWELRNGASFMQDKKLIKSQNPKSANRTVGMRWHSGPKNLRTLASMRCCWWKIVKHRLCEWCFASAWLHQKPEAALSGMHNDAWMNEKLVGIFFLQTCAGFCGGMFSCSPRMLIEATRPYNPSPGIQGHFKAANRPLHLHKLPGLNLSCPKGPEIHRFIFGTSTKSRPKRENQKVQRSALNH